MLTELINPEDLEPGDVIIYPSLTEMRTAKIVKKPTKVTTTYNNTIQLKWGTWSMREFCNERNITIDKYFEVLGNNQFDLDIIVKLIYIGYKSACISNKQEVEYTENDVCDWMDEIGSIFQPDGQVLAYLKYIVQNTITAVQGTPKEEKKKSNKAKLG